MATSPKEYLIVREPLTFSDHGNSDFPYPITYPLVILRCIYEYKKSTKVSDAEIKQSLEDVKKIIESAHHLNESLKFMTDPIKIKQKKDQGLGLIDSFVKDKFFIIYPTKSPQGIGLTLIDKTKGIYPMIFYAENDALADKGNRVHALKAVFDTMLIDKNYDNFMKVINEKISKGQIWDKSFQVELMDIYPKLKTIPRLT